MAAKKALDHQKIVGRLSGHRLVGIGESTHGTHEFFVTKAELFKLLVEHHGFNTLFFESIDDHCEAISQYLKSGEGDLKKLVNKLFYVWRTEEVLALFRWLRTHHHEHPVTVVGLDEREYVDDYANDYSLKKMNLRDKRMALVVKRHLAANPAAKGMIWAHDTHVAAYVNAPFWYKEQLAPMGRHLRRWYKKDYCNVAQLFGAGQFSAALIEESGKSDNRKLATHRVTNTPKDFWEYQLLKLYDTPTFLEGPTFGGLAEPHEKHKKRCLGWGVVPAAINEVYEWFDMYHAYDALIFFPEATASRPL